LFQYPDILRHKMNCPKCDLQTLPDQKFCRSCGASLQMITQPLAEHARVSDLERTPAITLKVNNNELID
jgi:hypothetical protein